MEAETIESKKQRRPAKFYAVIMVHTENFDGADDSDVEIIEASSSKELKKQLSEVTEEYELLGIFRGRQLKTKTVRKVDFKVN